jgi:hypothetical protein
MEEYIFTPVQITRNVVGMIRGPDPSRPSDALCRTVLTNLLLKTGAQTLAKQKTAPGPAST